MALDMNAELRATNERIDELKDWVDKRFEKIEDRRRSAQLRTAGVLILAMHMVVIYALARGFKWI